MFVGDENSYMAQDGLWDTLFLKGQYAEALRQAKASFVSYGRLEIADAMKGEYRQAMRSGAEALIAARSQNFIGAVTIARFYAHAGEKDRVLEWLQRAANERDMCYVVGDPLYASVRRDPRFREVITRVQT